MNNDNLAWKKLIPDWTKRNPVNKYLRPRLRAHWLRICADHLGLTVDKIVEVGVHVGKHAKQLRRFFDGDLYLVDPWCYIPDLSQYLFMQRRGNNNQEVWDEIYAKIVADFGPNPQNHIMKMPSVEAAKQFADESLDVVYLDGDHSTPGVVADVQAWLPKVKSGGILAGHDYKASRRKLFGVPAAIHKTIGQQNIVLGPDKNWLHVKP